MPGNTKLVGFLNGNRVQLERWGARTVVQLDEQAVGALRSACFNELPQRPVQDGTAHLDDFRADYDSTVGRVHVDLSPRAATALANFLDVLVEKKWSSQEEMLPYAKKLRASVQAHEDFINAEGEPGVENE